MAMIGVVILILYSTILVRSEIYPVNVSCPPWMTPNGDCIAGGILSSKTEQELRELPHRVEHSNEYTLLTADLIFPT